MYIKNLVYQRIPISTKDKNLTKAKNTKVKIKSIEKKIKLKKKKKNIKIMQKK